MQMKPSDHNTFYSLKSGWLLAALTIMMVTLNLDLTVANLALAPIARDLHIDMGTAQWIINGCVIAGAIFMPAAGRLGDMLGHQCIFISGAIIFLLASIAAGFAQGEISIISARVIQGIGIALSFPMIYAIIFRTFPENQRGMATGIVTAGSGFAQAIGPTLGGLLIHILNWRWVFFINIPLVIGACLILFLTQQSEKQITQSASRIDKTGIVLLALGLFVLMFTLNKAHFWGLASFNFIVGFISSLVLLVIFGLYEIKQTNPLLDIQLLTNQRFVLLIIIRMLYNSVFFVVLFTMGLMLQNILNYPTNQAGLIMLFMTIIFGIISPFCGRFIDKIGVHIPLSVGMGLMTLACILFAGLLLPITIISICIALFLVGVASGILLPSTSVAALSSVNKSQTGMATSLFYTGMFISSAIGVAIAGFILSSASADYLTHAVANANINKEQLILLKTIASGVQPITKLRLVPIAGIETTVYQAYIIAFEKLMKWCLGFSLAGLLLTVYLPKATASTRLNY